LKAVILPTTKTAELAPVTSWLPEFLLPVVKKPLVEHLIELLARHEIKEILLVLKHMPFETEAYFGDGSRWGVQLSYSLLSTYRGLVDALGHLDPSRLEDYFLCLPSDLVTDFDLSSLVNMRREELGDICLVRPSTGSGGSDPETLAVEDLCSLEGNPFLMTRRAFWLMKSLQPVQDQPAGCEIPSSPALSLKVREAAGSLEWIQSPIDLHRVNQRVLGGEFPGLIIPGKMVAEGVWVGRHCRIHPTVRLEAPVLIGDHCNLQSGAVIGSGSVVGDEVIVDEGAAVQGSLVLDRTYVGPHTDLKAVIVRKNWMVQIPSLLSIQLGDDLILGDLEKKTVSAHGDRLLNLALAIVLLIPALPLMAILFLYHLAFPSRRYLVLEERFGREEQRNLEGKVLPVPFTRYAFRSRNRLVRKLPGLINVIRGELSLVGVSALAASELGELPEEWREMRRYAPVGLFHLWELEAREDLEWEEQMVIDNYYAVSRSLWGDLKILGRGLYAAAFR